MFSHVTIGSNDVRRSKQFYDALLGAVGASAGTIDDNGRLIYQHNEGVLLITKPVDGNPATSSNGATLGFACDSPDQVDAWHAAGVGNGGTTAEDPPGVREAATGNLYLAYLRDPDGHKLCALHRMG